MALLPQLRRTKALTQERDELRESLNEASAGLHEVEFLRESIAELELAREDEGWLRVFGDTGMQFSRDALRAITRQSRIFFLKNPLMRRAALTTTNYTFAQGVTFKAVNESVNEVIQEFMADPKNKAEVTDNRSMQDRDIDLQTDGNLFFVFFTNDDGDTRIRTLPFDEITDIRSNPEDVKDSWYYERQRLDNDGKTLTGTKVLYPDWRYKPEDRPPEINGMEVMWDNPVYHVKVNALSSMKFGLSELYSAQDWARAYTKFLSDWATITRSLAKFAWKLTTKGKADQRAAAKTRLDSGISTSSTDLNPAPSAGSVFIASKDSTDMGPIKTSGATAKMEDGKALLQMVSSTTGIFDHYLSGDPSTGNLATATAMERPMQLMFINRQRLWQDIWENIFEFVIWAKARAATAGFGGSEELNDWGELVWTFSLDGSDPLDTHVDVIFPDIVEQDIDKLMSAIKIGATLDGQPFAGTLTPEYTTRQILMALGETSIEELLDNWFPEDDTTTESVRESVKQLRDGIREMIETMREESE